MLHCCQVLYVLLVYGASFGRTLGITSQMGFLHAPIRRYTSARGELWQNTRAISITLRCGICMRPNMNNSWAQAQLTACVYLLWRGVRTSEVVGWRPLSRNE